MKTLIAFTLASLYGLLLRFFFAFYSNITEVLSLSLVGLAPFCIGYLTVALSGLKRVPSGTAAFFRPWVTSLMVLVLTIVLALEGTICWIMIYPFFSIVAGLGGLTAYFVMREKEKREKYTSKDDILDDFDRNGNLKSSVLLLMPMLIGVIEQDRLLSPAAYTVTRSIDIPAPQDQVWAALTRVPDIKPEEDQRFITRLLGLPRHLRTELDTLAVGGKRTAYFERGLYFEEKISALKPAEQLTVAIKADPGSVPPTVLDEHIVIGGRHFKALEDSYRLRALSNGHCRLELSGRIEINTPFNWYSALWARWLLSETFDNLLKTIRLRATTARQ